MTFFFNFLSSMSSTNSLRASVSGTTETKSIKAQMTEKIIKCEDFILLFKLLVSRYKLIRRVEEDERGSFKMT